MTDEPTGMPGRGVQSFAGHSAIEGTLMHMQSTFPALIFCASLVMAGCSGAGFQVQQLPPNGYDQTLNYQFQAQVYSNAEGECMRMTVRVKALNKVYWKKPPPERLQLFDDDCMSPLRFERVQYYSADDAALVRLVGIEVSRFWSEYFRLEDELMGWLWREGVD